MILNHVDMVTGLMFVWDGGEYIEVYKSENDDEAFDWIDPTDMVGGYPKFAKSTLREFAKQFLIEQNL